VSTKVSIDGVIHDEASAKISIFDRGFLYGDSAFEVMRTYGGRPFAEREHLERLAQSCARILIEMPVSIDALANDVAATLDAAKNQESYVRVIVTRGSGPISYDPTTAKNPTRVVLVVPLAPQPDAMYRDGVEVACLRASRPTEDPRAYGVKASNYLSNLLAVHEAKQRGAYEAVLLTGDGQVLEGASSNVFVVSGGAVRTPPLTTGILAGITRATVFDAARAAGIPLVEATVFPHELYAADEAFLTSTLREVLPVVRADGRTIGTGKPGPVTSRLHEAFRREVERRLAAG
jgi:branched-chain amino acid aminotransferase